MALVMLPSDMPWWHSIQKILTKLSTTKNTMELIEGMQRIHDICNVSLDPDEDVPDPDQFIALLNFLDNDLSGEERSKFLDKTFPNIVKHALNLKKLRPKDGLHFSLQQQPDCMELDYGFVSALLANAFFSTFPKRTEKSHPTLQNFNFCHFFKHLSKNSQKAKLKGLLYYFDYLEENEDTGTLQILRQVMSSKEWLTIEDWLECILPLCPLQIKHEGRLERADPETIHVCFSSSKIGGTALGSGNSQECVTFLTFPDILCTLLNVEALEDNETIAIEGARHLSRITDPKNKACVDRFDAPAKRTVCCLDAEDYSKLPLGQYEEDNVLRELNKCLLAFQQKQKPALPAAQSQTHRSRRLSPIGESTGSSYSDKVPIITQDSCSTYRSDSSSSYIDNNNVSNTLRVQIEKEKGSLTRGHQQEGVLNNRRGKFIVLGSSGECLPVKRRPESKSSTYSSVESSEDEFHSAKTSLDDGSEDEEYHRRYSTDLETPEQRTNFAQRLRDALKRESSSNLSMISTESPNYAVDITVGGSGVRDKDIKVKRGGSTGFILSEESLDEVFLEDSLQQEKQWIDKFKTKQSNIIRKDSSKSSDYSFSTDYSSELEEVYEQFSKWLEDPIIETEKGTKKELEGRDLAVVQFAGALLKRTLSESFAGVPFSECCENLGLISTDFSTKKNKLILNAKSLSLELAKQKHRLAAQLREKAESLLCPADKLEVTKSSLPKYKAKTKRKKWALGYVTQVVQTLEDICIKVSISQEPNGQLSQIAQKPTNGLKAISTGNWGCGSSKKGEVQLKIIIQWLAASVAGVPALIYYTAGHIELASLDTIYRLLRDRKWTVRDLAQATLRYSFQVLHGKNDVATLFEELIGTVKS